MYNRISKTIIRSSRKNHLLSFHDTDSTVNEKLGKPHREQGDLANLLINVGEGSKVILQAS
jgi:hypothetical protein